MDQNQKLIAAALFMTASTSYHTARYLRIRRNERAKRVQIELQKQIQLAAIDYAKHKVAQEIAEGRPFRSMEESMEAFAFYRLIAPIAH